MALSLKLISLMARKSKGRQKIEMTKMKKESNLLVTFSKRRSGLFKKASELATLCGVEIAIVVFSPGKKPFSFGHPSVEAVADKFFNKTSVHGSSSATSQLVEAHRSVCVHKLNVQLTELMNQLDVEKKKGEVLKKMRKKPSQERGWWECPIEEMGLEQLQQLKMAMEELKKNVVKQAEKLQMMNPSGSQFPNSSAATSFCAAGPSTSSGLGVPMKPHAQAHGYGVGYGYGDALRFGHGQGHGYFG